MRRLFFFAAWERFFQGSNHSDIRITQSANIPGDPACSHDVATSLEDFQLVGTAAHLENLVLLFVSVSRRHIF
jgi:hypothetical protein